MEKKSNARRLLEKLPKKSKGETIKDRIIATIAGFIALLSGGC